ncbi:surface protein [Ancylomarina subtilis]|uniref:Surface protein n=1 Tax=Ancylomarina subtilis TaxID=1639035 RepID=A0A4Q7VKD1_9BACT|nr:BspA family leucine-rich repeat surface protein [Ancylomarina subtilis]RZT96527.1 surface protein [Ancylomarina subtilis]
MKQIIFISLLIAVLFSACKKKNEYSDQKEITSFTFEELTPNVAATINETDGTITAELPFGTNIKTLIPTIIISTRAKVSPASNVATDFTKPVNYTVTAEDGTTKTYVFTVTLGANDEKTISSFTFEELSPIVSATINETNATISAKVPFDTDVTTLTPTIIISANATINPESNTAKDFTKPVTYTLTAEDGTTKTYIVTVILGANDEKAISSFIFEGLNPKVSATIDETGSTITAKVPMGTNLTLTPIIAISENATISPASGTAIDFTKPVNYTVTAEDGTTKTYVINVIETIPFISVWKTTKANEEIELPLVDDGVYDFTVNWGDGRSDYITDWNASEKSHSYIKVGEYTVSITGQIEGFSFYDSGINGTPNAIIDITQWGEEFRFGNKGAYFKDCFNLTGFSATNTPNLEGTLNMSYMFFYAKKFNGDISNWDVSNITDMNWMFYQADAFNKDISNWDVSNVTDMSVMFAYTSAFNQDISNWDVSAVTDMSYMFSKASVFNQDLSNWNVSAVIDMQGMFSEASAFNKDLSSWDVSTVTNMYRMFMKASAFNQDISNWDVAGVTDMSAMFSYATIFNQDISNWDVSAVTTMESMFSGASVFNQNLNEWNISAVTNTSFMFIDASAFNGDISSWDVSAIKSMSYMFYEASAFNQDLSSWDVSQVTNSDHFDVGASAWTNSAWKPNFP